MKIHVKALLLKFMPKRSHQLVGVPIVTILIQVKKSKMRVEVKKCLSCALHIPRSIYGFLKVLHCSQLHFPIDSNNIKTSPRNKNRRHHYQNDNYQRQ